MKKIISVSIVIATIFLPFCTRARFQLPNPANLTIVVNTTGGDDTFHFDIIEQSGNTQFLYNSFDLAAINGTSSTPISLGTFGSSTYFISETFPAGWSQGNISCTTDNPSNTISVFTNFLQITNPVPDSNITCVFSNSKASLRTPILIVPGLFGTDIFKGTTLLWADVPRMVNPLNDDSFMDALQFNASSSPIDTSLTLGAVIQSKPLYNYTGGLINLLTSPDVGYTEGKDLFTFPYDWRFGVSEDIVNQLKGQIDYILNQTDAGKAAGKVEVIAHSTGGLVVKKYIGEHSAGHHIDKVIFVGVPNLGAPKAFKAIINGDNFDIPGLESSEMKKLSQNMPIAYDLAPSQQYVNQVGNFLKISNPFTSLLSQAGKELNYSESVQEFQNQHLINNQALSNSQNLHTSAFDNYDIRNAGVDVYNIIGCKSGTFGKFTEKIQSNGSSIYDFPKETTGDGTVPLLSAQTIPGGSGHIFFAPYANHGKMPSADGIRQQIVNLLTGSSLNTNGKILTHDDVQQHPEKCQIKGESIQIKSPVAIGVTDQDGNFSGLADDGSIQNDILGADYEIWGDHKYVFLPTGNGQAYNIQLKGTGTGTFTINDQSIDGDNITQTQVFSNLPVTPDLTGAVNLGSTTTLTILSTPTSTPVTVQSSSILNSDQSDDLIPPTTTSTFTGTQGQPGFYRSNVSVALNALDVVIPGKESQTSGVLKTNYMLDGGMYQTYNTSSPISIATEGTHVLSFFSTDRAGNSEQEQSVSFTIDKIAPELSANFSTSSKDFVFTASDVSDPNPLLVCQIGQCAATDKSGNITVLKFDQRSLSLNIKILVLKTVTYNGQTFTFDPNLFSAAYTLSGGNVSALTQTELIKNQQVLNIIWAQKTNQSVVTDLTKGAKPVVSTVAGLKVLQIATVAGKIQVAVK